VEDDGGREILRFAQNDRERDSSGALHPQNEAGGQEVPAYKMKR